MKKVKKFQRQLDDGKMVDWCNDVVISRQGVHRPAEGAGLNHWIYWNRR